MVKQVENRLAEVVKFFVERCITFSNVCAQACVTVEEARFFEFAHCDRTEQTETLADELLHRVPIAVLLLSAEVAEFLLRHTLIVDKVGTQLTAFNAGSHAARIVVGSHNDERFFRMLTIEVVRNA